MDPSGFSLPVEARGGRGGGGRGKAFRGRGGVCGRGVKGECRRSLPVASSESGSGGGGVGAGAAASGFASCRFHDPIVIHARQMVDIA